MTNTAAVKELQAKGYAVPNDPEDPSTPAEKAIRARFDSIKGSAVNLVLREGNSDRRAAIAVKNYAKANPHSMGKWASDSKTTVSTMAGNDFFSNEKSATLSAEQAGPARIELVAQDGRITVLKDGVTYTQGTVVDATFMSAHALDVFLAEQIAKTKAAGTGNMMRKLLNLRCLNQQSNNSSPIGRNETNWGRVSAVATTDNRDDYITKRCQCRSINRQDQRLCE